MPTPTVLIVDDDAAACAGLSPFFASRGIETHVAKDAENAFGVLDRLEPDILVTELVLRGMNGVELTQIVRERKPRAGIIVVTGHGDFHSVCAARDAGADAVLGKPVDLDALRSEVEDLLDDHARACARDGPAEYDAPLLIGQSPPMVELFNSIYVLMQTDLSVLVEGETGTGKECVARAIHCGSARSSRAYVAANFAADRETVSESELFGHVKGAFTGADSENPGLFAAAKDGTFVLDEIGDAPPRVQRGLLRVLQEGVYRRVGGTQDLRSHARIIALSNRDLARAAAEGVFRQDLYYRLKVGHLVIPPLRERKSDIRLLVEHFLVKHGTDGRRRVHGLTDAAWRKLHGYDWPGNVRELENCLMQAITKRAGKRIRAEDLELGSDGSWSGTRSANWGLAVTGERWSAGSREGGGHATGSDSARETSGSFVGDTWTTGAAVEGTAQEPQGRGDERKARYKGPQDEDEERQRMVAALTEEGGNKRQAAARLGMSRSYFYVLFKRYGITEADWAGAGE